MSETQVVAVIGLSRVQNRGVALEVWQVDGVVDVKSCRQIAFCPACMQQWLAKQHPKGSEPPFFPADAPFEYSDASCSECGAMLQTVEVGLSRIKHLAWAKQVWQIFSQDGNNGAIKRCPSCAKKWRENGMEEIRPPAFPINFSGHCRECGGELEGTLPI